MQTAFSPEQLNDPDIALADDILRKCVHCGFCTATCPTFTLLGDEADSPRGRIYLIKDYLESGGAPSKNLVTHLDRCLTCLSCMTTCPSGVNYRRLADIARHRMETGHGRGAAEQFARRLLAMILPYPKRFKAALQAASVFHPLRRLLPDPLRGMVEMAPANLPKGSVGDGPGTYLPSKKRKVRVALLTGCAQKVIRPSINEATIRLLTRLGAEVVIAEKSGCCGALAHHLGREEEAKSAAWKNISAWKKLQDDGPLDAVVSNASGCGFVVKDYEFLLRDEPGEADAREIASLSKDVTEVIDQLGLPDEPRSRKINVTYHAACSLQHGQGIKDLPAVLLKQAGYDVRRPVEEHLCCGSAGTYSVLQSDISNRLGERKAKCLSRCKGAVVATGNIGCLEHLGKMMEVPVVHTVELLDWATGGPVPPGLE